MCAGKAFPSEPEDELNSITYVDEMEDGNRKLSEAILGNKAVPE